jgi:hypothetical protein
MQQSAYLKTIDVSCTKISDVTDFKKKYKKIKMKLKPWQVWLHFYCGNVINIISHTILPLIYREFFKGAT